MAACLRRCGFPIQLRRRRAEAEVCFARRAVRLVEMSRRGATAGHRVHLLARGCDEPSGNCSVRRPADDRGGAAADRGNPASGTLPAFPTVIFVRLTTTFSPRR